MLSGLSAIFLVGAAKSAGFAAGIPIGLYVGMGALGTLKIINQGVDYALTCAANSTADMIHGSGRAASAVMEKTAQAAEGVKSGITQGAQAVKDKAEDLRDHTVDAYNARQTANQHKIKVVGQVDESDITSEDLVTA